MARLLSVNVGLPRDIEWKGRTGHIRDLEGSSALQPSCDEANILLDIFDELQSSRGLRGAEELLQFLEGFVGSFFLQEMAAIETAPGNR
jgi:hypothetical protein